jgi:hypothetical protein
MTTQSTEEPHNAVPVKGLEKKENKKMKKYTFQTTRNLFNEEVVMVLRNSDKQHIVSIDAEHRDLMTFNGFNPNDNEEILNYLKEFKYL